jgi:hypothetical protein
MSGAIHPLPQYAFMAWCLVKSTGTTLPFLPFTTYEAPLPQPPATSSLLRPNIFLSTLNLCSSLCVRGQVSYSHKTGKIIGFYTF